MVAHCSVLSTSEAHDVVLQSRKWNETFIALQQMQFVKMYSRGGICLQRNVLTYTAFHKTCFKNCQLKNLVPKVNII